MTETTFANWKLSAINNDGKLVITVTNLDDTPVFDTEADLGCDDTIGYRLTSQGTESQYKANGDANGTALNEFLHVLDYKITLVNDDDNQLGIFCQKMSGDPEHLSLTNGTQHSKECEIIVQ